MLRSVPTSPVQPAPSAPLATPMDLIRLISIASIDRDESLSRRDLRHAKECEEDIALYEAELADLVAARCQRRQSA